MMCFHLGSTLYCVPPCQTMASGVRVPVASSTCIVHVEAYCPAHAIGGYCGRCQGRCRSPADRLPSDRAAQSQGGLTMPSIARSSPIVHCSPRHGGAIAVKDDNCLHSRPCSPRQHSREVARSGEGSRMAYGGVHYLLDYLRAIHKPD